jgi:hypothetical protein
MIADLRAVRQTTYGRRATDATADRRVVPGPALEILVYFTHTSRYIASKSAHMEHFI